MRPTTALTGVSLAFVLTGCGTVVETDGVEVRCLDRHATINHASARIEVRPETVKLCRGYTLTLELRPPVATGTARTKQPTPAGPDGWLDSGNADELITVTAPESTSTGERKYIVEIDGVGLLDPRIVVQ